MAACVNLVPNVTSIYKWEGEVNEDTETLMVKYYTILNSSIHYSSVYKKY